MNKKVVSIVLILVILTMAFASVVYASSNKLLRLGSRGSDVRTLQQRLNSLGYNCGNVDGIFGNRTLNAVKNFQRKNGLAVDGIVGPATRGKLYGSTSSGAGTGSGSSSNNAPITGLLRMGSRGSQVSTLQRRLNQLGYNCGSVDGIFGSLTYNAVVRFQRANKLAVDGIVGPATIAKLYPSGSSSSGGSSGSSGSGGSSKPPAKPDPAPDQLYRVRKSWGNAASQIGAFRNLSGAKQVADQNPGYKVFDSSGKVVYSGKSSSKPETPAGTTSILSKTKSSVAQMEAWARSKNATQEFINLASLYMEIAPKEGVNPEGAYAQAAHETGYGRFGGVIDASFKNPCGLKTGTAGDNDDHLPEAHQRFKSWEEGVQAHIDHLALYAGAKGYPKKDTPDPRHGGWLHGKAKTFRDLGGKWAPSPTYGERIENLIRDILNTK